MKFCRENVDDLKKYYQGAYMKFPVLGDEVVYVQKVDSSGMYGTMLDTTEHEGWAFTFGNEDKFPKEKVSIEHELILPKKSYFEYKDCAYILSRIPSKQYSRGINKDNTSIEALTINGFLAQPLGLELINAYTHKPEFSGFKLNKIGHSYPVSRRLAVCPQGRIFMDKIRIGYLDVKEGSINCNQALFMPELEHIIKQYNQFNLKLVFTKKTATKSPELVEEYEEVYS